MNDRQQLLVTAALLRRGRSFDHLSSAITLLALLLGLSPLVGASFHLLAAVLWVWLIILGLFQKYWAARVALDAELFQRIADSREELDSSAEHLDSALSSLRLSKPQAARDWQNRCQGALKLMQRQVLCAALQCLLAVLGILLMPWLL